VRKVISFVLMLLGYAGHLGTLAVVMTSLLLNGSNGVQQAIHYLLAGSIISSFLMIFGMELDTRKEA
jgi:hypothetical protein